MSEKHLAAGAPLPPTRKDTMRVYSMLFCPYGERTRLVLAHKQVPHETVNINLRKKPDWFLERNPLGTVPALEYNDEVVYESGICDEYLDEKYADNKLLPDDPYQRARAKILMDGFAKVISSYYAILRSSGEEREKAAQEAIKQLDRYEKALTGKFYGGNSPGMIDLHIWPWIERFPAVKEVAGVDVVTSDRFPKLKQWMEDMVQHPTVKAVWLSSEQHSRYLESVWVKGDPEYDQE